MERIPQKVIERLISGVDLVKLISRSVPLIESTKGLYTGICPFHRGEDRSLVVNQTTARFECSDCHFSGSAVGWLMFYDGVPFQSAIQRLGTMTGLDVGQYISSDGLKAAYRKQTELLGRVADYYHRQLESDVARSFLLERSISVATAAEFRIGFAGYDKEASELLKAFPGQGRALWQAGVLIRRQDKSYYPRFQNRMLFPIHSRGGDILGFGGRSINGYLPKYLNSSSSQLFNKSDLVYSAPGFSGHDGHADTLLIVEGYTDVIAVHQALKIKVIGTMGTALSAEHVSLAREFSNNVIVCFDGDRAGRDAALKALSRLFEADTTGVSLSVLALPDQHDPDSFIRAYGGEAFGALCTDAVPAMEYFVDSLCCDLDLRSIGDRAKLAVRGKSLVASLPVGQARSRLARSIEALVGVPLEYENVI